MKSILATTTTLLLLSAPAAAGNPDVAAAPPLQAQMQSEIKFLTGGVGNREQEKLRALESDYSVRVALTRADGAYLSDIDIVIEDAKGNALVETTAQGPILLAALEPGRYLMRASAEGRTTERRVIDVPKERDLVRLYVALEETDETTRP